MEWLWDLLFPKYCLGCRKAGSYICTSCLSRVSTRSLTIAYKNKYIKGYISLWKYEGVIKRAIRALKYKFAYQIGNELADIASEQIKFRKYFAGQKFILIPIPLHTKRERWRGFNQAELMGKRIAKNLNWQFESGVLVRTKQAQTQVGQHKMERIRNIRGNFAVNSEAIHKINGKMIVIFDDVATTGATLSEAAKVLKKSGARSVWGMTLAR